MESKEEINNKKDNGQLVVGEVYDIGQIKARINALEERDYRSQVSDDELR